MDQYTEDSQYDDDLTIGADDELDDYFHTTDIDLFEFGGDEESPIDRLKTLVLSIDWEITDEVLSQFNDEILDLKDIWADDKVNMVYLQALEKIGKYISREKADAHPNAIKLLLSMYYNLERIVLSKELSQAEKKQILLDDVRRFDKLKKLITTGAKRKSVTLPEPAEALPEPVTTAIESSELIDLKAIVLGIDWEITEKDLLELREEVKRLEGEYAGSRPRLVFLQGIGTLGAYIRKKQSNSHADAFKLLHSFYEGLEKIVLTPGMTLEQEKEILLPEVEKFNAFKQLIAKTLPGQEPEPEDDADEDSGADYSPAMAGSIAPAFADMPVEGTRGFQEEAVAADLGYDSPLDVDDHINRFFGEEEADTAQEAAAEFAPDDDAEKDAEAFSDAFFGTSEEHEVPDLAAVDRDIALQGVDVETDADDDSDEEELPRLREGQIAPALADNTHDASAFSEVAAASAAPEDEEVDEITGRLDDFFGQTEPPAQEQAETTFDVSPDVALEGVNVESEEDEEDVGAGLQEVEDTLDFEELAPAFTDLDDDLVVPDDVLSDSELPMEPAEMAGPEVVAFDDEPVEADLDSDISDLEPEEMLGAESEAETPDDVGVAPDQDVIKSLETALLEEDLSELEVTADSSDAEQDLADIEQEVVAAPEDQEIDFTLDQQDAEIEDQVDDFFALEEEGEQTREQHFDDELEEVHFEEQADELELEKQPEELEEPETLELEKPQEEFEEPEELAAFEPEPESEPEPVELEFEAEAEAELELEPEEEVEEITFDSEALELDADEPVLEDSTEAEADLPPVFTLADDEEEEEEEIVFELADEDSEIPVSMEEEPDSVTASEEDDSISLAEIGAGLAATAAVVAAVKSDDDDESKPDEIAPVEEETDEELVVADQSVELPADIEDEDHVESTTSPDYEADSSEGIVQEILPPDSGIDEIPEVAEEREEKAETLSFEEFPEDSETPEAPEVELDAAASEFADLKGAVQSLSLDLDDSIIQGVFAEVNALRQKAVDRPIEKTYLQLLSTVAQHIDQYRYNSDDQAIDLLASIMDDLEKNSELDEGKAQDTLLACTCQVLQWQQSMLNSLAVRDKEGFLSLSQASEMEDAVIADMADEKEVVHETEAEVEAEVDQVSGEDDGQFTHVVRNKIGALRDTLKKEIEELKRAMKK